MRFKRRRKEENSENERNNVLLESESGVKPVSGNRIVQVVVGNLDLDRRL